VSAVWTRRALGRFLLRYAERLARRLGESDRQQLRDQIARARQKVDSAKVLWASEQYVEGLRLSEEGLSESLLAVELVGGALPGVSDDLGADDGGGRADPEAPAWERALARLGASPQEFDQTRAALAGVGPSRPTLNDEVSPHHRRYTRTAVWVAENALGRIARLAANPSRIVVSRFLRLGVLAAVVCAGVAGLLVLRGKVWVKASGLYPDARYAPGQAFDGNPRTEWLLPNRSAGWITLSFSKRDLTAVKLLNCSNPPHNDRASRDVRLECLRGKEVRGTARHTFPTLSPTPTWVRLPLACKGVDALRVHVDSWHSWGGGLAELAWE
jgi:hypothetical protein